MTKNEQIRLAAVLLAASLATAENSTNRGRAGDQFAYGH